MDPHKLIHGWKEEILSFKMDLNFTYLNTSIASILIFNGLKIKRIQQTNNYDVILQNDVMTPLATLFAQTPVVYDYPFNFVCKNVGITKKIFGHWVVVWALKTLSLTHDLYVASTAILCQEARSDLFTPI